MSNMTGKRSDPEGLYRRVGRLIEVAPNAPRSENLSADLMKWLGQVSAVVKEVDDLVVMAEVGAAINMLKLPNRAEHFQTIMIGLYKGIRPVKAALPNEACC